MEKGLIEIIGLKVSSLIGVPDEERLRPQDLLIDVTIKPSNSLYELDDEIENTVDYFMVYELIKSISCSGERKLIETLAEEIINNIKSKFTVEKVEVRIKKFILPNTKFVSVILKG